MNSEIKHEKIRQKLGRLRLPEELPDLSFDPNLESARSVAFRTNLVAAGAGVLCFAIVIGAAVWAIQRQGENIVDPPLSTVTSAPSLPSEPSAVSEPEVSSEEEIASITPISSEEPTVTDVPAPVSSSAAETAPSVPNESHPDENRVTPYPTAAKTVELPSQGGICYFDWDGWIYYSISHVDDPENHGVFRMRIDGSQIQKIELLNGKSCWPIEIQDGWIYFTDDSYVANGNDPTSLIPNSPIYRMRPDGSEIMTYSGTEGAEGITLLGDWLYYRLNTDNAIYRTRIDGTEKQKLAEATAFSSFEVCEDGIFYMAAPTTGGYRHKIMRCDIDGGNPTEFLYEPVHALSLRFTDEEYLYFQLSYTEEVDGFKGKELYRVRFDGTDRQRILRRNSLGSQMELQDGWIYYTYSWRKPNSYNHWTSLYRVRADGSDDQVLIEKEADSSFKLYDNYITFTRASEGFISLYGLAPDGTEYALLYQDPISEDWDYRGNFVHDGALYVVTDNRPIFEYSDKVKDEVTFDTFTEQDGVFTVVLTADAADPEEVYDRENFPTHGTILVEQGQYQKSEGAPIQVTLTLKSTNTGFYSYRRILHYFSQWDAAEEIWLVPRENP